MTKIVFLPSEMMDGTVWNAQAGFFKNDYDVAVADLTMDSAIEAMADRAVGDHVGDGAVLVGLSMGGYVALDIVRRHPDKVLGLVLVATDARADSYEQKMMRQKEVKRSVADFAGIVKEHADKMSPLMEKTALGLGQQIFVRQQYAMMKRPNSFGTLLEILCPVLIVGGEMDRLVRHDMLAEIYQRVINARLETVKDAGHLVPLESPTVFNQILQDWLEDKFHNP